MTRVKCAYKSTENLPKHLNEMEKGMGNAPSFLISCWIFDKTTKFQSFYAWERCDSFRAFFLFFFTCGFKAEKYGRSWHLISPQYSSFVYIKVCSLYSKLKHKQSFDRLERFNWSCSRALEIFPEKHFFIRISSLIMSSDTEPCSEDDSIRLFGSVISNLCDNSIIIRFVSASFVSYIKL